MKGNSYLSDINKDLINFYRCLQNNYVELSAYLKQWSNNQETYYDLRDRNSNDLIEKAAIFYYLNRHSFNGIYRVNKAGQYNVPYGYKTYSELIPFNEISNASKIIKDVVLETQSFEESLLNVQDGDFVFLDPPYTVAHNQNGFIKYNQKIFSWEDQMRLKEQVEILVERDITFIMTNANHSSIRDLYTGIGRKEVISRYSVVGGKNAKRKNYTEILITNG